MLSRVREARRNATPAERTLWGKLRSQQLDGWKFRRQVWIGPFIADFFCAAAKLVVEIDGDEHATRETYDNRRTNWLASKGFRVIRFSNSEVMSNLEGVLEQILLELPSPSHSRLRGNGPLPLPFRERGL
jgi:very-short-patch-repair endonuclease